PSSHTPATAGAPASLISHCDRARHSRPISPRRGMLGSGPMLFDPDRHETLIETPWDETAARACIEKILRDAIDSFAANGVWPAHPLDRSSTGGRDDLYLGAAGTLWALNHLAGQDCFASIKSEVDTINRAWLRRAESDERPGLLTAGTGTLLMRAI